MGQINFRRQECYIYSYMLSVKRRLGVNTKINIVSSGIKGAAGQGAERSG